MCLEIKFLKGIQTLNLRFQAGKTEMQVRTAFSEKLFGVIILLDFHAHSKRTALTRK